MPGTNSTHQLSRNCNCGTPKPHSPFLRGHLSWQNLSLEGSQLFSSPSPPRVPSSTSPRKVREGVFHVFPPSEPRGGWTPRSSHPIDNTFPTLKFPSLGVPAATYRYAANSLSFRSYHENFPEIHVDRIGWERGQALGKEGERVLPRRLPATK